MHWNRKKEDGHREDCKGAIELKQKVKELKKNMIGERLYPLIHQSQPELAGKITGMLLEMDNSELFRLLENSDALGAMIQEALQVLEVSFSKGELSQESIGGARQYEYLSSLVDPHP